MIDTDESLEDAGYNQATVQNKAPHDEGRPVNIAVFSLPHILLSWPVRQLNRSSAARRGYSTRHPSKLYAIVTDRESHTHGPHARPGL